MNLLADFGDMLSLYGKFRFLENGIDDITEEVRFKQFTLIGLNNETDLFDVRS